MSATPFSSRGQLPSSQLLVPGRFLQRQEKDAHPLGDPGQCGLSKWAQECQPHVDWRGKRVLISRDTSSPPQLHLSFFKTKIIYLFTYLVASALQSLHVGSFCFV